MSIEKIGKQIAMLRKERGIKQEELAKFVGVSVQAVSKWENGGVPDTELLPMIADFFEVSVDSLFGRSITDYSDLQAALVKKITETPSDNRFKLAFDCCWDIERALFGEIPKDGGIESYQETFKEKEQRNSSILTNNGFTLMGIGNLRQYFLMVPEQKDFKAAYLDGIDYTEFFRDLSDRDVFNCCIMLFSRESRAYFTPNLIVKKQGIELEKAKHVISVLEKYSLLYKTDIEMDDETQQVYYFKNYPNFIAMLIFARDIISPCSNYAWYNENRSKPYIN